MSEAMIQMIGFAGVGLYIVSYQIRSWGGALCEGI